MGQVIFDYQGLGPGRGHPLLVVVRPASVVPSLNLFHDVRQCRKAVRELVVVVHLGFQVREEILGGSAVPTHACQSHRLGDLLPSTPLLKFTGGVLRPEIECKIAPSG